MRARTTRLFVATLALGLLAGVAPERAMDVLFGATALAAADEKDEKKARRIPNIQPATYRRLQQAAELARPEDESEPKSQEAVDLLESMLPRDGRKSRYNGNELGQVHDMLAYVYWELERPDKTIYHYEQVLAQVPKIAEGTELNTLFQLAKLYFMQGTSQDEDAQAEAFYRQSLKTMDEWLSKNDSTGADPYYFIAQIHYQLDDHPAGIASLETAVRIAKERGTRVKEDWWRMLQFMYYGQENWDKSIETLEILVEDFPKRDYWVTLAAVHGEKGEDNRQLHVLETAHAGGFLTKEGDIRAYGSLLLQGDVPYRASTYVQRGVDEEIVEATLANLTLLGQAYVSSEEIDKAITVFEQAGKLAEDGKTFDLLATLYLDKDKFADCQRSAESALDKGGLANTKRTKITLATCQFNLDRLDLARKNFTDVRRDASRENDKRLQKMASDWIKYIDNERKRRDEMARAEG